MKNLMCVFALLVFFNAHAQVVKCKDANGRVIYSDVACSSNSTSSAVNLSGGNITEGQVQAAQERSANNASGDGGHCGPLKSLAQKTFDSFIDSPNINRWNTAFQSLQNLANICASADVCGTIKVRIDHAQQRFNEDNKAVRGAHLNSVSALYANTCNVNGTVKQAANTRIADQSPAEKLNVGRTLYTKDEFGTLVRSDRCFMTKNEFGVYVRSAGCKK